MNHYTLGIDLGTTATKAAIYGLDGSLCGEGRADVPLAYPAAGQVEQDSRDFYTSAVTAIRGALSSSRIDAARIAAIAFDSQMAGIGAITDSFEPATPFDSWLDMRCRPYIEELESRHGPRITELTGCPPTCDHGPKMLWWKHERPADYSRIAKFVMPTAYVAGRMTGMRADDAFIDATFLHFSGAADARRGSWSTELCDSIGYDLARLPRIVEPADVAGVLTEAAARDTGLRAGTIVAAGAGDTAAGALGAGVVRPGMLLDTAGTASVFACTTADFLADTRHRALLVMRSVVPGIWNPLAYVGGGGLAVRWYRDQFGGQGTDGEEVYRKIFQLAEQAPAGSEGLLFSPHLGGRVCPAGPAMRGAWLGFSWSHGPREFFRAILESVGFEYAGYLRIVRELLPDLEPVEARVIGGGARSDLWNRIKSSILNVPYRRVDRSESATWGCALIAAKAAGLIGDLATKAAECAPVVPGQILPDPEWCAIYEPLLERYLCWQRLLDEGFGGRKSS